MPRDEGFMVADTATDKFTDAKFKRLWRVCQDEQAMNAACVLFEAVTLASWGAGTRVTAADAAPLWMGAIDDQLAALQSAGLLDSSGRIPSKSWRSWFTPAYERRENRRAAGAEGGRRKASNARATLEQRHSDALPVRPSVRHTVPTDLPRAIRNGSRDPDAEERRLQAVAKLDEVSKR